MNNITIVLGTRPEIIKLSSIIRECEKRGIDYNIIHTGQHYSDNLDSVFFEQLELPAPDYELGVGSKSHGEQTGEMIAGIEDILVEEDSDVLIIQGDTNSVLAGAIAASKLDTKIAHVEAGLRSFDRDMPEETNRVLTDHVAEYLFAPTTTSAEYLRDEGIDESRIYVTGNTVVDAVDQLQEIAEVKSTVLEENDVKPGEFVLLTAHRAENVDDQDRFEGILTGVEQVITELDRDVIYPIHPRAANQLNEFGLEVQERVHLIEPQDYLDFLKLQRAASIILTDSGGVQEEACILGVPCVTLRNNTERPETIDVGANHLVGTDPVEIRNGALKMENIERDWENPFGDGTASEQILTVLCEPMVDDQQIPQ